MKNAILVLAMLFLVDAGCATLHEDSATQSLGTESIRASLTTSSPDLRAVWSTSCEFKDGTDSYLSKQGGFDISGSPVNWIALLKRGTNSWVQQTATLSAARGQSQVFQLDDTRCVVIGGGAVEDTGNGSAAVDLLTFNTTTKVVNRTTLASLNAARSQYGLSTCVDNAATPATHIMVVAGYDGALGTPELRDVEVSPSLANIVNAANTWTRTTNILTAGRYNFGMDTDGNNGYVVAGGNKGGMTPIKSSIELFTASKSSTTCTPVAANTPATNPNLNSVTEGNVVFYDSSVSKFIAVAGRFSTAANSLWADMDTLTVTFGSPPNVTAITNTATPTNFTPTYRPTFLRLDSATVLLMGGATSNLTGAGSASKIAVQEYNAGFTSQSLTTGIYGGSAALLSNGGEAWIVAGDSTPGTRGTNTASFTVP